MGKGGGKGGDDGLCNLFFGPFYCVCIILFIGPLCLFLGLAIIGMSLDDDRGRKIREYNVAVEEWRAEMASPDNVFKQANFSYDISYNCGNNFLEVNQTLSGGESPLDFLSDGSDGAEALAPQYKFSTLRDVQVPIPKGCKIAVTFKTPEGQQLAQVRDHLVSEQTSYCRLVRPSSSSHTHTRLPCLASRNGL